MEVEYQVYNGHTMDTIEKDTVIPGVDYSVTVLSVNGGNYSSDPYTVNELKLYLDSSSLLDRCIYSIVLMVHLYY